jgi:hypothetical protein
MGVASYFRIVGYIEYTAKALSLVSIIKTLKGGLYGNGHLFLLNPPKLCSSKELVSGLAQYEDCWLTLHEEPDFVLDIARTTSGFLFRYFFSLEAILPVQKPIENRASNTIKKLWNNNFYPV